MGYAYTWSVSSRLGERVLVKIEVDTSPGLHILSVVGLGDRAVYEAKDRISSAIKNSGFTSPKHTNQKITIALSPGDIRKEGTLFDVGMAIAYLAASGQLSAPLHRCAFIGELTLDGNVVPSPLGTTLVHTLIQHEIREIFIPKGVAYPYAINSKSTLYPIHSLAEIVAHLQKKVLIKPLPCTSKSDQNTQRAQHGDEIALESIQGNIFAKRALIISLSGGHSCLLHGPPGSGKTMLAKAGHALLPALSPHEALEVSILHEDRGIPHSGNIAPFRNPHHLTPHTAILGGGASPLPGEISLAHRGILFLDELPEFSRETLEGLREPLQEKQVRISRNRGIIYLPADSIVIAAMNPCRCGYYGSTVQECRCASGARERYVQKISGPIIDRFEMMVHVNQNQEKVSQSITSVEAQKIIERVRILQYNRILSCGMSGNKYLNTSLDTTLLHTLCVLSEKATTTLNKARENLKLSMRTCGAMKKVARTIADIENSQNIEEQHMLEALSYRTKIL